MTLWDMAHGPDSYERRPPQPITPALAAEFKRRLDIVREAMAPYETLFNPVADRGRDIGYVEGLLDGLAFGLQGTLDKNHLLTVGDYERRYLQGVPPSQPEPSIGSRERVSLPEALTSRDALIASQRAQIEQLFNECARLRELADQPAARDAQPTPKS